MQSQKIWSAVPMLDNFPGSQKLPDPVPGCPNFRRVPGYKVYCCGQPTVQGFKETLAKVCGSVYPKTDKILWLNMRQEPNLYINGEPVCARPPNKIGEYAELGDVKAVDLDKDEAEFLRVCESRVKDNGGKLKVVDVNKKESMLEVSEMCTLEDVVNQLKEEYPGLVHMKIPTCNSAAPSEADFDIISEALTGTKIITPVIINDQVGLSRATTACVIACLFKEFQITASFDGLLHTVPGVNSEILRMDNYIMDPNKDPLFRGEFEVVKELVSTLKDGDAAKNECDKIIDKCGTKKTGGTGIKQLRENIAESKLSYEIMDDSAQAFLKSKIMDNIHKYFYLIVYAAYMREEAILAKDICNDERKRENTLSSGKFAIPAEQLKLVKTFAKFMDENSKLRSMIETGKGNLQWERDIPAEAFANLLQLAEKDFRGNLGQIIHDLYQTAHIMFSDMPQGDHKKRAKYRFASKTLMRILPQNIKKEVESLIDAKSISLDLYDVLGQCTWGQNKLLEKVEKGEDEPAATDEPKSSE